MAPKRGLGRGLSNLIPTDDTTEDVTTKTSKQTKTVLPFVVVVVMHHADVRSEPLGQMLGKGGLAGAGASGDADENGVHTRRPPAGFILSIIGNLRRKSKHSPAKVVKKA